MGTEKKTRAHSCKDTNLTLLNKARLDKGYTIAEVAMALGAKYGAVSPWITGNRGVPAKYAEKVAKLLDLDIKDLTISQGHHGAVKGHPVVPMAYTTTFWSKKRVEAEFTIAEVAKRIGIKYGLAGKYFTGMSLPDDDTIKRFCDMFDVDFMMGKGEFVKANQAYKALNKRSATCKGTSRKSSAVTTTATNISEPTPKPVQEKPVLFSKAQLAGIKKKAALTSLYGDVTYDEFIRLYDLVNACEGKDIVAEIYGMVDFDTFIKVKSILE